MSARREFQMTEADLATILKASQPVPYMVMGGVEPRSPQENANAAWAGLGSRMGFIDSTVRPIPEKSQLFFTAEPLSPEAPRTDLRTMFLRDGDESHETAAAEILEADMQVAASREVGRAAAANGHEHVLAVVERLLRERLYTLRRAWLDFYGVTCPCCRGEGETPCDELPATMVSPAEITMSACPVCRGVGEVLLDEAAKWIDAHLERFGDDDFSSAGLLNWLEDGRHPWVELREAEWGAGYTVPDTERLQRPA